jgi:hypothetical protein
VKPSVNIPYDTLHKVATQGSPVLLRAVGRLAGLGAAESEQLMNGGIPKWAIAVVGIGAGFIAGAWAAQLWPSHMKKVVGR